MPLDEFHSTKSKTPRKSKKPSIYTRRLNNVERQDLKLLSSVNGLDDEITLLRFKIKSLLLSNEPESTQQIRQLTDSLARLLKTRCDIGDAKKDRIEEAFNNVFRELVVPLGLNNIAGQNKP